MAIRAATFVFSLALTTAAAALVLAGSADGQTANKSNSPQCAANAADAVQSLPAPLTKWAQLICTPRGEIITGKTGWVWVEPVHRALVIIPAMKVDRGGTTVEGDAGYFTKIDVKEIAGEELDNAVKAFHEGRENDDATPHGYRLDVATSSGDTLLLYIFDYDSYGWGMSCADSDCENAARFVMVNMKEKAEAEAKRNSI